jgi:CrcB protein
MRVVLWSYGMVAVGGALGAVARFALNVMLQRDVSYAWGTLTANLLGCLIMGAIAQLVATAAWFNAAGIVPDQYRLLLAIGFCGSFTTLSALIMELHTMLQRNEILNSFAYLMITMIGGFACFYAGFMLMRILRGLP